MRREAHFLAGAVCAGLFYGYVLIPLGLRLRCPFRAVTGLRCPGCGITDWCLALLHGHFRPDYNWGLTLALPPLVWLLWSQKTRRHGKAAHILTWGLAAFLLLWAVARNLWNI